MEDLGPAEVPFLNGPNYSLWKVRMQVYFQARDFEMWDIVQNGFTKPTITDDNGVTISKPSHLLNDAEKRRYSLDAKAKHALSCALCDSEFARVCYCETARDMWKRLEIIHEGTDQAKFSKINGFMKDYELFKMLPGETIKDMYPRFITIVNGLRNLGMEVPNEEMVQKFLRSLTSRTWHLKVTIIEEAKDLKTLEFAELIGSLVAHEMKIIMLEKEEFGIDKKKFAIKSPHDGTENDESTDEDVALIDRKLKKLLKKKKFPSRPNREGNANILF